MGRGFRITYTVIVLILVIFYGYDHLAPDEIDKSQMIYPFLLGLTMIAAFFCVFLVQALFGGEFKIYDFLELVAAFFLLLLLQNAITYRAVFIGLFVVLLIISIYKLVKTPELELE